VTRAGVSKGTVYYYFEDKADLFATVMHHYGSRIVIDTSPVFTAQDRRGYWRAVISVAEQARASILESPSWIGLGRAFYQVLREDWFDDRLGEMLAGWMSAIERVLLHGQQIGAVRTDLPSAVLLRFVGAIHEAMERWALERWEQVDEGEHRHMLLVGLDTYRRLLSPDFEEMDQVEEAP
jgi:AcrR family transcriptional regulator